MRCIFIIFIALLATGCAKNHVVPLGDNKVIVQQYQGHGDTYVHLHHNETTALKAAKAVIHSQGGSLITLVHNGERNVVFHLDGKRYEFDPNRIFTDKGIKNTLQEYSQYSPKAASYVKKLATTITALIPEGRVIAVHNNKTYSLKNYFPKRDMASDAKAMYYNPKTYYRNFVLVTKGQDYYRLIQAGLNAVWQSQKVKDDGSLSVFLAHRNYINVEAGFDQLSQQIEMLKRV